MHSRLNIPSYANFAITCLELGCETSDMKLKACLTCKDRKIACDKGSPACQNCIRARRSCRPQRPRPLRLSWPSANEPKRALVGHSRGFGQNRKSTDFKFISTSPRDIEIYRNLHNDAISHRQLPQLINTYILTPSLPPLYHPRLDSSEVELIPYFFSNVLPALPAFGIDIDSLRSIVARRAFSDDSPPSQAVLDSLLALSTLYQSRDLKKANRFVATALNSLKVSTNKGIAPQECSQHIISGMLLCSFEIYQFVKSSSLWLLYLSSTKVIINQFHEHVSSGDGDRLLLYQWVFYYDTLACTGVKHWRGYKPTHLQRGKMRRSDKESASSIERVITRVTGCVNKALEAFSDFAIGVLLPDDPKYRSEEYISWVERIEERLISARRELRQQSSLYNLNHQSESLAVKELFVLAILLYVERQSSQLVGWSSKTDEWIKDAFSIISKIETCNKPFPLFMFGVYERRDDRRLQILEVLDRSIKETYAGSLTALRDMLVRLWIQDDLNAEASIDDPAGLCFFVSQCDVVPCLL